MQSYASLIADILILQSPCASFSRRSRTWTDDYRRSTKKSAGIILGLSDTISRTAVERLVSRAIEKVEETAVEAPRTPVRMPSTEGMFELSRTAHQVHGRAGTTKAGILKALKEIPGPFSYHEFHKAVSTAMRFDSASNRFDVPTRFASIDEAVRAWFNELKNKQKLIIPS